MHQKKQKNIYMNVSLTIFNQNIISSLNQRHLFSNKCLLGLTWDRPMANHNHPINSRPVYLFIFLNVHHNREGKKQQHKFHFLPTLTKITFGRRFSALHSISWKNMIDCEKQDDEKGLLPIIYQTKTQFQGFNALHFV